jgi:hypothetical protein
MFQNIHLSYYTQIIKKNLYAIFLGTLMTRRSEKNNILFGLQRGVTLSGNILKISRETYSQILIFC